MIAERSSGSAPAGGNGGGPIAPGIADLELHLLLQAVHRVSGYDFREYAPAMLKRRVAERARAEGAATTTGLLERVLHDPEAMQRFVDGMVHIASSPFRAPQFFAEFHERVLPRLRTFPHVRIWVIGSGEDAYALAILLREAEIYHRTRIYATDAGDAAVERAKTGALPVELLEDYQQRYAEAGGIRRFSDHIRRENGQAFYASTLREQIVFARHNLATDGSFNEFHLIVARNVIGQYNRTLAYRAHQVIFESLVRLGFLGLSIKETLAYTPHQRAYQELEGTEHFFRRLR